MKSDLLPSGLCAAWLAGFDEQVIHTSIHRLWGQLWICRKISPQKAKKIRDLSRRRVSRGDWLFFDQTVESHGLYGL
jgi:hypothetical protein